jgi:hypothetical protein
VFNATFNNISAIIVVSFNVGGNPTTKKKLFVLQEAKSEAMLVTYDKQLVHITVVLGSKNIFSSLECFQRLQLLNTHLVNFKFV